MTEQGGFPVGLRDAVSSGWFKAATQEMFTGFDIPPGTAMLDAGCGDGKMAGFCAPFAERLVLIDIEPRNVAAAVAHNRAANGALVEGMVSDCAPIPLADAMFDRVMCTEVLEHVDDPILMISELARVARPGALLLLTVPDPGSEAVQREVAPEMMWRKPHHLRVFGRDEFAALVTGAGLTIESRSRYGFFQAVTWAMFWACPNAPGEARHPALGGWESAWSALLDTAGGARVRGALDEALPKSQLIIARKPLS